MRFGAAGVVPVGAGELNVGSGGAERGADFKKRGGHGVVQVPVDAHGAASGMGDVAQGPEEKEWVILLRPDKQEESCSVFTLAEVAPAGGGVFTGGALRLPVETGRADGEILIARRGREGFFRFIEGDEEELGVGVFDPIAARLSGAGSYGIGETEGDEGFVARVLAMEKEREAVAEGALFGMQLDAVD